MNHSELLITSINDLLERIVSPDAARKGFDKEAFSHPLHSTLVNHGFKYSHSQEHGNSVRGNGFTEHSYVKGTTTAHTSTSGQKQNWSTVSAGNKTRHGVGQSGLQKHLEEMS